MTTVSATHLILIPSYNPGPRLLATVREALAGWRPVWVVADGSTDGSHAAVEDLARTEPGLRVIVRSRNGGKGAAVLTGAGEAVAAGFTHALVMDADGQHPADRIGDFMAASRAAPAALILGRPVFGPEAPMVRMQGRKLSVALVRWEIGGRGIDDPLFGFRVYPLEPLGRVLQVTRGGRHYDFDAEAAVRLVWAGTPTVNLPARCRYLSAAEGGITHFHYLRDNLRMIWLHTRLLATLLIRMPHAGLRCRAAAAPTPIAAAPTSRRSRLLAKPPKT
jgi:glycosyltransferase involved in cell wall biosynthesis